MAADLNEIFRRGGKPLIDLLEYCVRSARVDPVFVFLAGEYRALPTAAKAVALYHNFCAPGAPARLAAPRALPPYDLSLPAAVRLLEESRREPRPEPEDAPTPVESDGGPPTADDLRGEEAPRPLPARYLFDALVRRLEESRESSWRKVCEQYDPSLGPYENLPGGRMSAAQRVFVERVWEPRVRPRLVAAGFRRIADIA